MKIAHLFPDNSTFANSFIYVLNKFDGGHNSTFFLYYDEIPAALDEFESKYSIRAITDLTALKHELESFDHVVFHSLYPHYLNLIPKLKQKRIGWVFWGYEYYNYFETNKYEPLTKDKVPVRSIPKQLAAIYRRYQLRKVFKRIDDFYFWDELFYKDLKSKFGMKAKFHEFLYGRSILDPTLPVSKETHEGLKVLVGNSAYLSGNQLDVFDKIKESKTVTKVYTMLSYGFDSHRKRIIKVGERQLGKRFEPILEFLPYDRYLSMVKSVDVIICNHNRMQALGLIFNAILMERALIINANSLFFKKLKNLGIKLFEFDDLYSSKQIPQNILTQNREILLSKISSEMIKGHYQYFLE